MKRKLAPKSGEKIDVLRRRLRKNPQKRKMPPFELRSSGFSYLLGYALGAGLVSAFGITDNLVDFQIRFVVTQMLLGFCGGILLGAVPAMAFWMAAKGASGVSGRHLRESRAPAFLGLATPFMVSFFWLLTESGGLNLDFAALASIPTGLICGWCWVAFTPVSKDKSKP